MTTWTNTIGGAEITFFKLDLTACATFPKRWMVWFECADYNYGPDFYELEPSTAEVEALVG